MGSMSTPVIGWYGLGSMGIGMAQNLQKHLKATNSPSLHYSNRTMSRGESLKAEGGIPEDDFKSLVQKSDIIFTMISNDGVLDSLVSEALETGSLEGKLFIDTSTVHPDTSARCGERLLAQGAQFIASPVFGASPVAAAGGLIFAMAGPPSAVQRVQSYVQGVMGCQIINMGADVRASSLLKISGNIFVVGLQGLVAEAQVFAEKTGLGTARLQQFVGAMFGPVLESYSARMTTGAYAPPLGTPPGFAAALAAKDAGHALAIARTSGAKLPTIELAFSRLTEAREYAGESIDSASVYGIARMEAGLPFWNEKSRQGNE